MLKDLTVGFIGSGKIAEAMIGGLLGRKLLPASRIIASGPRKKRARELKRKYGIVTTTDNVKAAQADIVILAVKKMALKAVIENIALRMPKNPLVISVVAGIQIATLRKLRQFRIIRAMPNTPVRIRKGVIVWTKSSEVTSEQENHAKMIFGALGTEVFVEDEVCLDMATAVSGTGPAYVFLFMEALIDASVRIGLPRHLARLLVSKTMIGSAEYADRTEEHLAQLRNDVTSPAGTSAEALFELDEAGFRTAIAKAVQAAHRRSVELGKVKYK